MEGFNRQVQPDRLNGELQKQMERWIRKELQLYTGVNNAGARLSQLASIRVSFLTRPAFTFRPDRNAIAFSLNVRLFITGTVDVDALDVVSNLIFGINGTYPLTVDINNFNLSGEAILRSTLADAGEIEFKLNPQPGTIVVGSVGASTAPSAVRNGVRDLVSRQLSRPLRQTFKQRYDYFALTGLSLTPASAQTASRLQYAYQARPETAKPMVHIVARAADGKLYHMSKTEGGRSLIRTVLPFPTLAPRIENEPVLVASSTDQLELAATTVNSDLVYAHWRDETWGYQATFTAAGNPTASGYQGRPAMIASAPGQVEVLVSGRTGGLWHMRRLNGRLSSPVAVPLSPFASLAAPPYRDPAAVQSGNKVVVVFVDALNRLFAIAFDLESGFWGQPTSLHTQELIRYAPAAAASGDGRIDVVYAGQSGTPYHRVLDVQAARFTSASSTTGISIVNGEVAIGGLLNASPVLVCSSYKQLELIGRGTDNRLYHNHFVGPSSPAGFVDGRTIAQGWQGWGDLNGNFAGSLTFELMTGFSAAATAGGKVVLASIRQPSALDSSTNQLIYHNTYDSERYGTQPWKTVQWRGYEQVGNQRFVGEPALAVTDRQTALMYIGSAFTPIGARLAESNTAAFSSFADTRISLPPADPVLVSSVAGKYDVVEVGFDGRIRHTRRGFRGGSFTFAFPITFGQLFRGQPAVVAYGNGQLEMVAVAQNNTMFHWRYQNGAWTPATQISGTVISQPILIHIGSGQLVLLAVGGDRRLYLWSFTNGAWSNWQQVPTSFLINPTMFGQLAASSWGDGAIDIGLVDNSSGALYHGRIGPGYFVSGLSLGLTPSRPFSSLGGILTDTPILTALSPTRIHVLAVGTDRIVYSNWSFPDNSGLYLISQAPPILWRGYSHIGGYNLLMGGVAKLGSNELLAAGTDSSGRVMITRYNGANWIQFQPVAGPTPGTFLSPPLYRPAVTSFVR